MEMTALNGGPQFQFTEAISLQIYCDTQEEIDYYWEHLMADGGQEGPCGWLKDKFGVSWQAMPGEMNKWMQHPERARRIITTFMKMKKLDLKAIKEA
ncbi:VOC family protein [Nostoc ellipsosporum NOK]|nr:VOC family protein [Nostoc ellipsosporum NOK]